MKRIGHQAKSIRSRGLWKERRRRVERRGRHAPRSVAQPGARMAVYNAHMRLTRTAKRAGCAAKHPPGFLFPLLQGLPKTTDPNVLVGSATADDAALYRIDETRALVFTLDFFTPIVDSPRDFGTIAAANALSDVYAMGGTPISALNIVGFPDETLEPSVLAEILQGGSAKAREAGIDIVGGHTIKTDEPIYGLSVTGIVDIARAVTNAGGKPGDLLVLTKPIGVGIVTTAAKQDRDRLGAIDAAIALMATLNRAAMEAMQNVPVHAATDITGFGLLGHLRNMATASGCTAKVVTSAVPFLDAARTYVEEGIAPGGTHANLRFLNDFVDYDASVDARSRLLLCDAQTSGGLLMACTRENTPALLADLSRRGTPCAAVIGSLEVGPAGRMRVER
jgi:selenide, water dikinase